MRLVESRRAGFGRLGPEPRGDEVAPVAAGECRALVAVVPTARPNLAPAIHRTAPFLAQLIATKDGHPQTRERRRAEPEAAIAAYCAMAALTKRH